MAMTRREQALNKIRRLERQLDIATDCAGAKIENEINRLQATYDITLEEIKAGRPKGVDWFLQGIEVRAQGMKVNQIDII